MRWLVDGNNVMGARPDGWWRDRPGAKRALATELANFARTQEADVTVIFDGTPIVLEEGLDALAVEFAPDADDAIAAFVADDPLPGDLTVVTSDRGLRDRVEPFGVHVLGAGAFRRRVEDA